MNYSIKDLKELFVGYDKLEQKNLLPLGYDYYLISLKVKNNNVTVILGDFFDHHICYEISLKQANIINCDLCINYQLDDINIIGVSVDDNKNTIFYISGNNTNFSCSFQSAQINQTKNDDFKLREFMQYTYHNIINFKK